MANTENKNGHRCSDDHSKSDLGKHIENSASAQRSRLLAYLERKPISTIEARRDLDIMMPAARIFELRKYGHNIVTYWRHEPTDYGKIHRVALYVLVKEHRNV